MTPSSLPPSLSSSLGKYSMQWVALKTSEKVVYPKASILRNAGREGRREGGREGGREGCVRGQ